MNYLSAYEKEEIQNLLPEKVYYWGRIDTRESMKESFEDELGFYKIFLHAQLKYRYEILKKIGNGTFSEVIAAYDHKERMNVCIKIYKVGDKANRISEAEFSTLRVLNDTFNDDFSLKVYDFFHFRNHACIVMELLGNSLFDEQVKRDFKGFSLSAIKESAECILHGLVNLSKVKLVHGDLKLQNIVYLKESTRVKIIDYNISKFLSGNLIGTIQTLPYRAPEVMLGIPFGLPTDVWSLGIILVELFIGKHLFDGITEKENIAYIVDVLGNPPQELIESSDLAKKRFKLPSRPTYPRKCKTRKLSTSLKKPCKLPELSAILAESKSPEFIDFIQSCLQWDQKVRITPTDALNHQWIRS